MKTYDAVVVGAGPSGCQCARSLAKLGWKTLLVEKVSDFRKNNFSSAATVIEIMADYDLPDEVVGTPWKQFQIIGTSISYVWSAKIDRGVVFDFQKLREFLSNDAKQTGNCDILFGHTFHTIAERDSQTELTFKTSAGSSYTVNTNVVVDATGSARAVIYHNNPKPVFTADTGIEYLIRVKDRSHTISHDTLQFFLGSVWQPHGYAWIFPMGQNVFKIGTALYDSAHQKDVKPLKHYVERIIHDYLKLNSFESIEVHGSTLLISSDHRERFYHKNIVGIGDTISAVNSLGGEGIRHGMYSANIAADTVDQYLKGTINNFSSYEKQMRKYFGLQWRFSNIYSYWFYNKFSDSFIDTVISALGYLNIQEIIDIFFYYKFLLMFKTLHRKLLRLKKSAILTEYESS